MTSSRDGPFESRGDVGRRYRAYVMSDWAIRQEHTRVSSSVLFADEAVGGQNEDGIRQRGEHRLRAARDAAQTRIGLTTPPVADDDRDNQRQDAESKSSARHRHVHHRRVDGSQLRQARHARCISTHKTRARQLDLL